MVLAPAPGGARPLPGSGNHKPPVREDELCLTDNKEGNPSFRRTNAAY